MSPQHASLSGQRQQRSIKDSLKLTTKNWQNSKRFVKAIALAAIALAAIALPATATFANNGIRYNITEWSTESWAGFDISELPTHEIQYSDVNDVLGPGLPPWRTGGSSFAGSAITFPGGDWDMPTYTRTNIVPEIGPAPEWLPLYEAEDWRVELDSISRIGVERPGTWPVKIAETRVRDIFRTDESVTRAQAHSEVTTWAGYDAADASAAIDMQFDAASNRYQARMASAAHTVDHPSMLALSSTKIDFTREFTLNRPAQFNLQTQFAALEDAGFNVRIERNSSTVFQLSNWTGEPGNLSGQRDTIAIDGLLDEGHYEVSVYGNNGSSPMQVDLSELDFQFNLSELPGTQAPQYVLQPGTYKIAGDETIYEAYPGDVLPFDLSIDDETGQTRIAYDPPSRPNPSTTINFGSNLSGIDTFTIIRSSDVVSIGSSEFSILTNLQPPVDPLGRPLFVINIEPNNLDPIDGEITGGDLTLNPDDLDGTLLGSGPFPFTLFESSGTLELHSGGTYMPLGSGQSASIRQSDIEFWTDPYWELVSGGALSFDDFADLYDYDEYNVWDLRPDNVQNLATTNAAVPNPTGLTVGLLSIAVLLIRRRC